MDTESKSPMVLGSGAIGISLKGLLPLFPYLMGLPLSQGRPLDLINKYTRQGSSHP